MSKKRSKFLKTVRQYVIQIIVFVLVANSGIAFLIFSKAQNANCMYQDQINSDSRCLYVYHNEVYEKGTKSRPHQGVDCGTNVDSTIPSLHFSGGIQRDFNTAKIGSFCGATAPTAAPTQAPTSAPTEVPTQAPTAEPTQQSTDKPKTQATATQKPTSTPSPLAQVNQTSEPVKTPEPTKVPTVQTTLQPVSGNTFGDLLGKPSLVNEPIEPKEEGSKFELTSITKPITYISVLGFIGSIVLLFIF